MNLLSRIAVAMIAASLHFAVAAQAPVTEKTPPRRLPPTGSQSADIPAGVDTGSPSTSNAMPLGTPVPPAMAVDRGDQNKRSAAARLASRPIAPARAGSSVAASSATARDCAASAVARRSSSRPCP